MECREALNLISFKIDGTLSASEASAFEKHIANCVECERQMLLAQKIGSLLKGLGQEEVQAPPEFCNTVMAKIKSEPQGILTRIRTAAWRRAIAVAAMVMLVAGSTAGFSTKLSPGVLLGYNAAIQEITVENDNFIAVAEINDLKEPGSIVQNGEANNTGSNNDGKKIENIETNVDPAGSGAVNKDNETGAMERKGTETLMAASASSGTKVLLNNEMKAESIKLWLTVEDLATAKSRATALALESGAVVQVFSEQSNSTSEMFLRITVDANKAPVLISKLEQTGVLTSKLDEERDLTALYNEKVVNYNELQYRINNESNDATKQQLEIQALSIKQQLDTWEMEANNFVVNLWLKTV